MTCRCTQYWGSYAGIAESVLAAQLRHVVAHRVQSRPLPSVLPSHVVVVRRDLAFAQLHQIEVLGVFEREVVGVVVHAVDFQVPELGSVPCHGLLDGLLDDLLECPVLLLPLRLQLSLPGLIVLNISDLVLAQVFSVPTARKPPSVLLLFRGVHVLSSGPLRKREVSGLLVGLEELLPEVERVLLPLLLPGVGGVPVLQHSLPLDALEDHHALEREVVEPGAVKLGVVLRVVGDGVDPAHILLTLFLLFPLPALLLGLLFLVDPLGAVLALDLLPLVVDDGVLVADAEEVGGVDVAGFDELEEVGLLDFEDEGVLLRDDVVVDAVGSAEEVGVEEHGHHLPDVVSVFVEHPARADVDVLHDGAVEAGAVALEGEPHPAALEDHDGGVGLVVLGEVLAGVVDLALEALREADQRRLLQVVEEGQVREQVLVRLHDVLVLQVLGDLVQQLRLLVVLELLLDGGFLTQEGLDASLQVAVDLVLLGHALEDGDFAAVLGLRGADGADDVADFGDVVGEDDAAEELEEGDDEGLAEGDGQEVAEADGHHDGGGPVEAPHVLDVPELVLDLLRDEPVVVEVEARHGEEQRGQEVREEDVEERHLDQVPVLLLLEAVHEGGLDHAQVLVQSEDLHQRHHEDRDAHAAHVVAGGQRHQYQHHHRDVHRHRHREDRVPEDVCDVRQQDAVLDGDPQQLHRDLEAREHHRQNQQHDHRRRLVVAPVLEVVDEAEPRAQHEGHQREDDVEQVNEGEDVLVYREALALQNPHAVLLLLGQDPEPSRRNVNVASADFVDEHLLHLLDPHVRQGPIQPRTLRVPLFKQKGRLSPLLLTAQHILQRCQDALHIFCVVHLGTHPPTFLQF